MKTLSAFFLLFGFIALPAVAWAEDSKVALTNGDEIRLRSEPSKKGKYVGILYKNMVVTILDRSKDKDKIEDKEDYWYKVKRAQQEGWCFGQFLNLNFDQKQQYDTYETTKDLGWFFERYGEGTGYEYNQYSSGSFTPDEYRSIIKAVQEGKEYRASDVLQLTLFKALDNNPNDPKLAYFKEMFDSEDFWLKNKSEVFVERMPEKFRKDKAFLTKLEVAHPGLSAAYLRVASKEIKEDQDFVLDSLKRSKEAIYYFSQKQLSDEAFMLKAVKIQNGAFFHVDDQMKEKLKKAMPELAKLKQEDFEEPGE